MFEKKWGSRLVAVCGVDGLPDAATKPIKPVERWRFSINGDDSRRVVVSTMMNEGENRWDLKRRVILVEDPVVSSQDNLGDGGAISWFQTLEAMEAAEKMGSMSRNLRLGVRVSPELKEEMFRQACNLRERALRAYGKHHLQVTIDEANDGGLLVKSELVSCGSNCLCRRRNFKTRG